MVFFKTFGPPQKRRGREKPSHEAQTQAGRQKISVWLDMLSADVRARSRYLQLSGNICGLTEDCQASRVDIMLKSISKTPARAEPVNHTHIKLVEEKKIWFGWKGGCAHRSRERSCKEAQQLIAKKKKTQSWGLKSPMGQTKKNWTKTRLIEMFCWKSCIGSF